MKRLLLEERASRYHSRYDVIILVVVGGCDAEGPTGVEGKHHPLSVRQLGGRANGCAIVQPPTGDTEMKDLQVAELTRGNAALVCPKLPHLLLPGSTLNTHSACDQSPV